MVKREGDRDEEAPLPDHLRDEAGCVVESNLGRTDQADGLTRKSPVNKCCQEDIDSITDGLQHPSSRTSGQLGKRESVTGKL